MAEKTMVEKAARRRWDTDLRWQKMWPCRLSQNGRVGAAMTTVTKALEEGTS